MDPSIRLCTSQISKTFGATQALDQVDFELRAGEIHALLGENGAGKSTLIKILAGDYGADKGEIRYEDNVVRFRRPADSRNLGIRVIYQEFNLVSTMTVAENICLGSYPSGRLPGTISPTTMRQQAQDVLQRLGEDICPNRLVRNLSVAQQQVVEIAKALLREPTVLIMDEPTSALNDQETDHLFELLRHLRDRGVSIIYISHRIDELFKLANRVTVLRDGRTVGTFDMSTTTPSALVQLMVGRELTEMYPKRQIPQGSTLLEVKDLSAAGDRVRHVSFEVHRGEIVAIFGLLGAGQSELAQALFGVIPITSGTVLLEGSPLKLSSTSEARQAGIGLVPEDRKTAGLVGQLGVKTNLTLAALPRYARSGFVRMQLEDREATRWADRLNVKRAGMSQQIRFLSGGNQQKVIIARWLADQSRVLVLDQPTRGVDVGAKVEIYRLLEDLCEQGVGVVIISIEMPEVLGVADRVYVMCEGRMVGPYLRAEVTKHHLMSCAVGIEGGQQA